MSRRESKLGIYLLLVILIGAGLLFGLSNSRFIGVTMNASVEPPAATHRTARRDRNDANVALHTDRNATTPAALHAISDPFVVVERSATAEIALQTLLSRVLDGDVRALEAASRLYGYCHFIWEPGAAAPKNDSAVGSTPFMLRQQAFQRRQAFCGLPPTGYTALLDALATYQTRMQTAAAAGDDAALAHQLFLASADLDAAGADAALQIARTSRNPDTFETAMAAFMGSPDPRVSAVFQRVFSSIETGEHQTMVSQAALQWESCQRGATSCAAYNFESESDCIYFAECYSHLSRQDYIRTRMLSARQFEQMQQLLDLMRREWLQPGG